MTTALATTDNDKTREVALLKAVGLDRLAPEQRELALNIAQRYDLDLLLKHLVMIEGRPYITRDALLWIAHRSGQFDGIETTVPAIVDDEWRCTATVWRKDMSHPFTYPGRYPTKGGNQKFAPEMAIKVAESMALRRAFNVAAPVAEERWDVEVPAEPAPKPPSLAERVAERAAVVREPEAPAEVPDLGQQFAATGGQIPPDIRRAMTEPPAEASEAVPEPLGLDTEERARLGVDEFQRWLATSGVPIPQAKRVRLAMFPDTSVELDDYQRAELKEQLEALAP